MNGNQILNNEYNVKFNIYSNNASVISYPRQNNLYYPPNASNYYKGCNNLVFNLQSDIIKHNYVINMIYTYYNCGNLTGSPVCGPNVISMNYTYYNCRNLKGNAACGSNVTSMHHAYQSCINLNGKPNCGNNVINMSSAFYNCTNLTGSPVCGNNVIDMTSAYYNCYKLTGSPVVGANVENLSYAYNNCTNLTGTPKIGENVIYLSGTYNNCWRLYGDGLCGNKVTSMDRAYYNCWGLNGIGYIYDNVKTFASAFTNTNIYKLQINSTKNYGGSLMNAFRNMRNLKDFGDIHVYGRLYNGGNTNEWSINNLFNGCVNITSGNIYFDYIDEYYNNTSPSMIEDNVTLQSSGSGISREVAQIYMNGIFYGFNSNVNKQINFYVIKNTWFDDYFRKINMLAMDPYGSARQPITGMFAFINAYNTPIVGEVQETDNGWIIGNGYHNTFHQSVVTNQYIRIYNNYIPNINECNVYNITKDFNNNNFYMKYYNIDLKGSSAYIPDWAENCSGMYTYANVSGTASIPDNVKNCEGIFRARTGGVIYSGGYSELLSKLHCNISSISKIGNNIRSLNNAFEGCVKLTTPICPDYIYYLVNTYAFCANLTSIAVGNNVIIADLAYAMWAYNSENYNYFPAATLTATPKMTDITISAYGMYNKQCNMYGSPVMPYPKYNQFLNNTEVNYNAIKNNAGNFSYVYYCCNKLSGPIIQNNIDINTPITLYKLNNAFYGCRNIYGNLYVGSYNSTQSITFKSMFYGRNTQRRMNVYVVNGINEYVSNLVYNALRNNNLSGSSITWTNGNDNYCYNTTYNIYLYKLGAVK